MYGKHSNKQKMRWGAAGQCLLILLSFLPVWLLSANNVPAEETADPDTLTTLAPAMEWAAETTYPLDIPRP